MLCLLPSLFKMGMTTVKEAAAYFKQLVEGFDPMVQKVMDDNKEDVRKLVTGQLYSGVNGNDKSLRPKYTNDPWFKTEEAGRWKNNPKGYAAMKNRTTPPERSFQGYPARDYNTPNLIITGTFHDSIRVSSSPGGLKIETRGTDMGADIERKYGSAIFGIGKTSRKYFLDYMLKPELLRYFHGK